MQVGKKVNKTLSNRSLDYQSILQVIEYLESTFSVCNFRIKVELQEDNVLIDVPTLTSLKEFLKGEEWNNQNKIIVTLEIKIIKELPVYEGAKFTTNKHLYTFYAGPSKFAYPKMVEVTFETSYNIDEQSIYQYRRELKEIVSRKSDKFILSIRKVFGIDFIFMIPIVFALVIGAALLITPYILWLLMIIPFYFIIFFLSSYKKVGYKKTQSFDYKFWIGVVLTIATFLVPIFVDFDALLKQ